MLTYERVYILYIYHVSRTLHPIHLADIVNDLPPHFIGAVKGVKGLERVSMYGEGCEMHQRKIKVFFGGKVLTTKKINSFVKENLVIVFIKKHL